MAGNIAEEARHSQQQTTTTTKTEMAAYKPAVPSASPCSSRGRCLNFISPKYSTAHVQRYRLIFSSSAKPRTAKPSYTKTTNALLLTALLRNSRIIIRKNCKNSMGATRYMINSNTGLCDVNKLRAKKGCHVVACRYI